MEFALVIAVLATVVGLLAAQRDHRALLIAIAGVAIGAGAWWLTPAPGDAALERALPGPVEEAGFATSDTCRSCHPSQYQSWHDSYHRTMTQAATPETVLANWDDVTLVDRGQTTRLSLRGSELWAEVPDPLWLRDHSPERSPKPPTIQVRVVMTTGSHHLQNFWFRRPESGDAYLDSYDNGALVQLPWVWMIAEGRWSPVQDSFLTPRSPEPEPPAVWNTSCHLCHSVGTEPRFDGEAFDTRSAELGIACEACHGPGEEHLRANRSPLRRYGRRLLGEEGDPTIVNPARLDQARSSEVCGQCHSFTRVVDIERWQRRGLSFRPGDELAQSKALLLHETSPRDPHLLAQLADEPNALVGRYWEDGTIRVAGRELNGMVESGCYQRGDMTCLSCHSLHDYADPSDQLSPDRAGDESCLQCHPSLRADPAAHTRHAADSSGSRCLNCHMPHTTYGLFVAMRSHRVDSPSVAVSKATGRPNACNLCHLDQTLGWTDAHLVEWYGTEPTVLDEADDTVAAAVEWLVRGDAAQRSVAAWHMGWEPAQRASGRGWQAAHLAVLLADPYVTVRRVAQRSIETLPGFEDFEYDHLWPADKLDVAPRRAWARWRRAAARHLDRRGPALLLDAGGELDMGALSRLHATRDDTPLRIIE